MSDMSNETMDAAQVGNEAMAGGHADDPLTGHCYDGIEEYDNPLPGWWKFLFWVSIIFAPFYVFYFHAAESRSIHAQFERERNGIFEARFALIGDLTPDRETILEYKDKADWLAFGKGVYNANCVGCHGAAGEGKVGPNLTDAYWKNVSSIEDIATVIADGAGNGAMPAWGNRGWHPNQIVLAAAYVASLRDQPVDGKAPEGREIPEWE
jgi:cytochrome c oxidase cbb3-type subunit 3